MYIFTDLQLMIRIIYEHYLSTMMTNQHGYSCDYIRMVIAMMYDSFYTI
jgi:hypothetical protein